VRQQDAHAWAEVWLAGSGWTRVDPTAAIAPERIELGLDAIRRLEEQGLVPGTIGADALAQMLAPGWVERALRQARLYWDYTNIAWYHWVIDYRRQSQENFLHSLGFETIEWPRVIVILGGGCLLLLLGYAVWSRRAPPSDPAQRIYLRFCRKLARAGVARAPHEGALDFSRRACARLHDSAIPIDDITARYLRLRYGANAGQRNALGELRRRVRIFMPNARRQRLTN